MLLTKLKLSYFEQSIPIVCTSYDYKIIEHIGRVLETKKVYEIKKLLCEKLHISNPNEYYLTYDDHDINQTSYISIFTKKELCFHLEKQENTKMSLFVSTITNKIFTFECNYFDSISEIKKIIQHDENMSPWMCKYLLFGH